MKRDLTHYRSLPYTRRCQLMVEGHDRYWHAWIVELPGCEVDGPSKAEAYVSLGEVFEDYVSTKLEWGSVIPEPSRWPDYGKQADSFQKAMSIVPVESVRGRVGNVQESDPDRRELTAVAV